MAAFSPQIVFFDIDDTLYHKSQGVIPASALDALAALHDKGIMTAIATGRVPSAFPAVVNEAVARFGMDAVVSINGQYGTFRGELRFAHAIPKEDIAALVALCRTKDWAYLQATDAGMMVSRDDDIVRGALGNIGKYEVNPDAWLQDDVYQLNVYVDEAGERELHASGVMGDAYQTVRWHENGVDYLPSEGSKARGIRAMCREIGIDMDQVMVFGDGLNDVEMFRAAGFAVAMGNARPELKAVAGFVTRDVDDDGIWHALRALNII